MAKKHLLFGLQGASDQTVDERARELVLMMVEAGFGVGDLEAIPCRVALALRGYTNGYLNPKPSGWRSYTAVSGTATT